MAAGHGKDAKLYINGADVSAFFTQASSQAMADVAETTTFQQSAKTYIAGVKDGTISAQGLFAGAAGEAHAVLAAALGLDGSEMIFWPQGDALGAFGQGVSAEQTRYSVEAPVSGVVTTSLEAQSSVGIEPVVSLRQLASASGIVAGTGVDNAASTANGGAGYLHVAGGTFTAATIKVQHSVDNSAWTDLITFTLVSGAAPVAQRSAVAGTVNRYLRSNLTALTGANINFGLAFARA